MNKYKVTFSNGNSCTLDACTEFGAFCDAIEWFLEIGVHVSKSNFTIQQVQQ